MSTHPAIVTAAVRGPLEIRQFPTVAPGDGQVLIRVGWAASSPLELHQNDGGLLVTHPQGLGGCTAGQIAQVGPNVANLKVGDDVFGFAWRNNTEKAYQEYITVPEFLVGKIPAGFKPQEAVTLPSNFVTVFHTTTANLGLPLEWPRPAAAPAHADDPILIWGGSSSVGQFALQILRFYGYRNLFAAASKTHHEALKGLGAAHVFDYREAGITDAILKTANASSRGSPAVPYIIDCIGSANGSLAPISKIAQSGTKIAVMMPVIIRDASETVAPEYSFDVSSVASWAPGVDAAGVRTHFYLENEYLKEQLQSIIMPAMLAQGIVKPQRQRIIEGATMLERAQKAMDALRRKEPSGERLVWRVAE